MPRPRKLIVNPSFGDHAMKHDLDVNPDSTFFFMIKSFVGKCYFCGSCFHQKLKDDKTQPKLSSEPIKIDDDDDVDDDVVEIKDEDDEEETGGGDDGKDGPGSSKRRSRRMKREVKMI